MRQRTNRNLCRFYLILFDHCFTSNGSNVAKSLIPAITLAPEHIGHFLHWNEP